MAALAQLVVQTLLTEVVCVCVCVCVCARIKGKKIENKTWLGLGNGEREEAYILPFGREMVSGVVA